MASILIIEDNAANMRLACLLMRNAGHTALCAVDAETGLTLARADQPDLILMDIQLPGMDGFAATALLKQDPATAAIPVIALTSMAMKEDQAKSQAAGCDAYIAKPLRYQELYAAIDALLIRKDARADHEATLVRHLPAQVRVSNQRETTFISPSREEALLSGRLVLVAEDNRANQKLIVQQLALLGFAADVAGNGRLALERWQSGSYALLLTDLQMPEMDGFALTQAIRAQEQASCRIPIVALTANAVQGEADHCRSAGMDDCLRKPVQLADLKAALEAWVPTAASSMRAPPEAVLQDGVVRAVDVSVLESLIGNDPAVILDFLNDFRISAAKIAQALKTACTKHQALQAGRQAHKLMSSARSVGALVLGDVCEQMDAAGKAGSTDHLMTLLPMFEGELDAVNACLDSLQAPRIDRTTVATVAPGPNASAVRILLLDDEPFMHKLLTRMLAGLGFNAVTSCDSGSAALERVDGSEKAPNLILMDLNMPQMDGIEFVRKLVECNYAGSLVLVSGEDERVLQMAEKLVRAHQITVLGHLKKPVSLVDLAMVLDQWKPADAPRAATKTYSPDELRAAIANNELVNYYQPKVAVATGEVIGVETLVRWRHPVDGMVFPDQFIGVAEEYGLIDALTRVVLVGALAQSKAWRLAGLPLRVAVNISMDNLSSVVFADFVAAAAIVADVAPQEIVLELTESRLMLDQRAPLEILTRLRLKRFRLSIDDFGTGHSSLSQLLNIRFDELKIDQGFVRGAWRDETALAMYNASLGLGRQLGMEVVAEGVEDRDDWNLVRRTGCDLAQGYFIARPMPASDLASWIETWKERAPEWESDPR